MKGLLTSILMSVAILLAICSCATVSKEPLAPGQLRLLHARVSGSGVVYMGTRSEVNITFEADGKPTIRRVCFSIPKEGQGPDCYYVNPRSVEYGEEKSLRVTIPPPRRVGPALVDCYVEYWQDTKVLRTNVIHFSIDAIP